MALVSTCGHHCGVTADPLSGFATELHCPCGECHDDAALTAGSRTGTSPVTRKPSMCSRWYDRAGDHRPWVSRATGCVCGVSAQALPEQHGEHCPTYQFWARSAGLM